jgi:glycerol-3-phosphate dehydrogenase
VLNYCGVTGFEKRNGKIVGVDAFDEINQTPFRVSAKAVINATGVFGDSILRMADDQSADTIAPSQGIHLVVDPRFFSGTTALMIPKTDDGRVLFVIPWQGKLLLGTTDTPVEKILSEPQALPEEIDFIISHFNRYTTSTITTQDIESVFVGLRPLAKTNHESSTSVMPRDHVIKVFPSGLVHVTGGKWTTYRNMAEHAIDQAVTSYKLPVVRGCQTKQLRIHGGKGNGPGVEREGGVPEHLRVYGSDAIEIQKRIDDDPKLAERIHSKYPYCLAEVQWCIENEMACTVEDVLARRIRLLFLDARAAIESAPVVASLLTKSLDHDDEWQRKQVADFSKLAEGYLVDQEFFDHKS